MNIRGSILQPATRDLVSFSQASPFRDRCHHFTLPDAAVPMRGARRIGQKLLSYTSPICHPRIRPILRHRLFLIVCPRDALTDPPCPAAKKSAQSLTLVTLAKGA